LVFGNAIVFFDKVRDVRDRLDPPDHVAVIIAKNGSIFKGMDEAAVFMAEDTAALLYFTVFKELTPLAAFVLASLMADVTIQDRAVVANHLIFRKAGNCFKGPVNINNDALFVDDHQAFTDRVGHGAPVPVKFMLKH